MVVGGAVHVGGRLERLVFPQLMGRACSLRLGIGVKTRSVVVLQLRGVGWYSGGNRGIVETPRPRIVGKSNGVMEQPWLRVEEEHGTFPGSCSQLPWLLDLYLLYTRIAGIDVLPGSFVGKGFLGIDKKSCYYVVVFVVVVDVVVVGVVVVDVVVVDVVGRVLLVACKGEVDLLRPGRWEQVVVCIAVGRKCWSWCFDWEMQDCRWGQVMV